MTSQQNKQASQPETKPAPKPVTILASVPNGSVGFVYAQAFQAATTADQVALNLQREQANKFTDSVGDAFLGMDRGKGYVIEATDSSDGKTIDQLHVSLYSFTYKQFPEHPTVETFDTHAYQVYCLLLSVKDWNEGKMINGLVKLKD